jgi:ribonuclease P protein component
MAVQRLKKRGDFLSVAQKGRRFVLSAFIIQTAPSSCSVTPPRVGFTVTKRIGNAVVRNYVRRRLRALVQQLPTSLLLPNHDYVFIARHASTTRDYAALTQDAIFALTKLQKHS